ncbi:hypothetical protein [Enterococcus diestrammenae]|uniref:Uncharacterized protein n=1 Tax=Enterococcus diestrammenae TaxID=1155073 RepID=A0ABV0EY99_9ENTE|nr:hypothetical protein [Enterococcus diestrammenae]KAF1297999.1 hypothetical protein BAU18_08565 [Enterococcus diestrammenae]HIX70423.1 hypothetical protein [Candidatus Enterococcus stercoravium]
MKTHLDTSLGVMIQEPDKKNLTKQTLNYCKKDPNPDSVVALIDIFAPLIPEDSDVMSVIETTKTEYVK